MLEYTVGKKSTATLPSILNIFLIALFRIKMYIVFERVTNFANFVHFKILMNSCSQAYRPVFVHGGEGVGDHRTKIALVTNTAETTFARAPCCLYNMKIVACLQVIFLLTNHAIFANDLSQNSHLKCLEEAFISK